jgi:hypothetical protein
MKDYTVYFEQKERINGSFFYCLKGDYSETDPLQALIRSIHEEQFYGASPDDWIYAQIYYAFDRLSTCEDDVDFGSAYCEVEPDVYSSDLLEWAKSGWAREFIAQAIEGFEELIGYGQVYAVQAIYDRVWAFLKEREGDRASHAPSEVPHVSL